MKNKLIKVKQFIIKNLLGMIIGGVVVGSISIATANYAFESSNVYYNKSSSGGSYSNVQDSITELYSKANSGYKIYKYEGTINSSNYEGYYNTVVNENSFKPISIDTADGTKKTTMHLPVNGFFKNKNDVGFFVTIKPYYDYWKFKDIARYLTELTCYNYTNSNNNKRATGRIVVFNTVTETSNDGNLGLSCKINSEGNIDLEFSEYTASPSGTATVNQNLQATGERFNVNVVAYYKD